MIEAFLQREDAMSWRFGTIAATIRNQNATNRRDLVDWREILPPMAEASQKKKRGMTIDEIRQITQSHLAEQR